MTGSADPEQWPATRLLGRAAVPGHLELDATHLRFVPSGVAARVQGTPFAVQLRHIAGAGVAEAAGGLLRRTRTRLAITLGDGTEQLFDVADPQAVAGEITGRLQGRS